MAIQAAIFKGLCEILVVYVIAVESPHQDGKIVVPINQGCFRKYPLDTLFDCPRFFSETLAKAMDQLSRRREEGAE